MDFTCIVGEPCAISLVGVELEIDDAVTLHRARFRRTSTCADGVVRWGWGDRLAQPAPVYGFESSEEDGDERFLLVRIAAVRGDCFLRGDRFWT